ncbi:MAG: hypothetical protein M3Q03_19425 [Chloroflexota bacterium]|nr:hypothetical protein [Chloroflexota bacterium]
MPLVMLARSRAVIVTLLVSLTLSGCGSGEADRETAVGASPTTGAASTQAGGESSGECSGGRLTVGDLRTLDAERDAGMAKAYDAARAWQRDARLIGLRVGCELVGTGIRWRATFYSKGAEELLVSDTGEVTVAPAEAERRPTLVLEDVSFANLGRWLSKASFSDTTVLDPVSGIEVRPSSEEAPYGPPDAPRNAIYFHVAILDGTGVKDLFVNASDGTIYRYR